MSTTDFDALLSSLSSSVREAQRSLSSHHQGRLKRLYTDDSGTNLTWTFYIASEDDDNHYRPIELPLVSLRSRHELNISELSIEMTCSLEPATASDLRHQSKTTQSAGDAGSRVETEQSKRPLTLVLQSAKKAFVNNLTRIKILLSANRSQGRVLLNERELKRFDLDNDS